MDSSNSNSQKVITLWQANWFQRWLVPVLIFSVAFLPRAIYPVSRPDQWAHRAYRFANAIVQGELANTLQSYHPGVSLMWLSGLGLEFLERIQGEIRPSWFFGYGKVPAPPGLLAETTLAQVLPLALVISLGIALTYPILSHLSGRKVALVAGLFLALDPYSIAYSKVIHVDALLAILMILSALFLLLYIKEWRWKDLIISAVFAGFAFLTKSSSIFLLPYAMLVVAVSLVAGAWQERSSYRLGDWGYLLWRFARSILIWLGMAILTFIIFFPATWVVPGQLVQEILDGVIYHTDQIHMNPIYFLGRLWREDPGIGFYLAVVGWKSTAVTLPLVVAAVIFGFYHRRKPESRVLWALFAYVFFFLLQMGIGGWKQIAYVAPIFPALSIIAAFGLVWLVDWIARIRHWKPHQYQPAAILALVIVLQALLVLRHFPYFGAHHNLLLGGSSIAAKILPLQDQGEGLDLAAQYLNDLPYGQTKTAALYWRNAVPFERDYLGRSTRDLEPAAQYRIYDINSVMREFHGDSSWQKGWLEDQDEKPLWTVEFDGVTYVWVYGDLPEDPVVGGPTYELNRRIGDQIILKQARLSQSTLAPGEPLIVVLYWEADGLIDGDYTVFNHVISGENEVVAQADNIPLLGTRPTRTWLSGEILEDPYFIRLDESLTPGEYELSLGMYDTLALTRIPAYGPEGERLPDDKIVVGTVTVK